MNKNAGVRRPVTVAGASVLSFVALGVLGVGVVSATARPDQDAGSCPKGPLVEESASRDRLEDLAGEAQDMGRAHAAHFSGVGICSATGVVSIYRIPGNPELDSAMEAFGRERHVTVALKDTRYSAADARETADVVKGRYDELARNGVEFSFTARTAEGYVKVAVVNDVTKARHVLSDLGDRIQVIQVERSLPL